MRLALRIFSAVMVAAAGVAAAYAQPDRRFRFEFAPPIAIDVGELEVRVSYVPSLEQELIQEPLEPKIDVMAERWGLVRLQPLGVADRIVFDVRKCWVTRRQDGDQDRIDISVEVMLANEGGAGRRSASVAVTATAYATADQYEEKSDAELYGDALESLARRLDRTLTDVLTQDFAFLILRSALPEDGP